jgi:hypothetical protein
MREVVTGAAWPAALPGRVDLALPEQGMSGNGQRVTVAQSGFARFRSLLEPTASRHQRFGGNGMSTSTTQRMTIGDFLLRRREEAGIGHLFGVPGDFDLELLQQLEDGGR